MILLITGLVVGLFLVFLIFDNWGKRKESERWIAREKRLRGREDQCKSLQNSKTEGSNPSEASKK